MPFEAKLILAGSWSAASSASFAVKTLLLRDRSFERTIETRLTGRDKAVAVGSGLVFGYLLGLTSVGSGTFFGMVLVLFYGLRAARVVGTDIFHAAILVWAAAIAHAAITQTVEFGTVGWLLAGSVPGILLGAQGTSRAPERALRGCIAAVLAFSGVSLLVWLRLAGPRPTRRRRAPRRSRTM